MHKEDYLYIERDAQGNVEGIYHHPHDNATERLPATHPDVIEFFTPELAKEMLHQSDFGMIRVIEDIIELLIMKEVISITDLPDAVLNKLNMRRIIREKLHGYTLDNEKEV